MYLEKDPPGIAKEHILDAVTNGHDRRILALAQTQPMEAQEIMDATGIPRSTVYRRVSTLLDRGLLDIEEAVVRNGHRVERYKSVCAFLGLIVQDGSVEIQWTDGEQGGLFRATANGSNS